MAPPPPASPPYLSPPSPPQRLDKRERAPDADQLQLAKNPAMTPPKALFTPPPPVKTRSQPKLLSPRLNRSHLDDYPRFSPRKKLSADFSDDTYSADSGGESPNSEKGWRIYSAVGGPFLTGPLGRDGRDVDFKSPRGNRRVFDLDEANLLFPVVPAFVADLDPVETISVECFRPSPPPTSGPAASYQPEQEPTYQSEPETPAEQVDPLAYQQDAQPHNYAPPQAEFTPQSQYDYDASFPPVKHEPVHQQQYYPPPSFSADASPVLMGSYNPEPPATPPFNASAPSDNSTLSLHSAMDSSMSSENPVQPPALSVSTSPSKSPLRHRSPSYADIVNRRTGPPASQELSMVRSSSPKKSSGPTSGTKASQDLFDRVNDGITDSVNRIMSRTKGGRTHGEIELSCLIQKIQTQFKIMGRASLEIRDDYIKTKAQLAEVTAEKMVLQASNKQLTELVQQYEEERKQFQQHVLQQQQSQAMLVQSSTEHLGQRILECKYLTEDLRASMASELGQVRRETQQVSHLEERLDKLTQTIEHVLHDFANVIATKSADGKEKKPQVPSLMHSRPSAKAQPQQQAVSSWKAPLALGAMLWGASLGGVHYAAKYNAVTQIPQPMSPAGPPLDVEALVGRISEKLHRDFESSIVQQTKQILADRARDLSSIVVHQPQPERTESKPSKAEVQIIEPLWEPPSRFTEVVEEEVPAPAPAPNTNTEASSTDISDVLAPVINTDDSASPVSSESGIELSWSKPIESPPERETAADASDSTAFVTEVIEDSAEKVSVVEVETDAHGESAKSASHKSEHSSAASHFVATVSVPAASEAGGKSSDVVATPSEQSSANFHFVETESVAPVEKFGIESAEVVSDKDSSTEQRPEKHATFSTEQSLLSAKFLEIVSRRLDHVVVNAVPDAADQPSTMTPVVSAFQCGADQSLLPAHFTESVMAGAEAMVKEIVTPGGTDLPVDRETVEDVTETVDELVAMLDECVELDHAIKYWTPQLHCADSHVVSMDSDELKVAEVPAFPAGAVDTQSVVEVYSELEEQSKVDVHSEVDAQPETDVQSDEDPWMESEMYDEVVLVETKAKTPLDSMARALASMGGVEPSAWSVAVRVPRKRIIPIERPVIADHLEEWFQDDSDDGAFKGEDAAVKDDVNVEEPVLESAPEAAVEVQQLPLHETEVVTPELSSDVSVADTAPSAVVVAPAVLLSAVDVEVCFSDMTGEFLKFVREIAPKRPENVAVEVAVAESVSHASDDVKRSVELVDVSTSEHGEVNSSQLVAADNTLEQQLAGSAQRPLESQARESQSSIDGALPSFVDLAMPTEVAAEKPVAVDQSAAWMSLMHHSPVVATDMQVDELIESIEAQSIVSVTAELPVPDTEASNAKPERLFPEVCAASSASLKKYPFPVKPAVRKPASVVAKQQASVPQAVIIPSPPVVEQCVMSEYFAHHLFRRTAQCADAIILPEAPVAPAIESDAPAVEVDAPAVEVDAPAVEVDAPAVEVIAPVVEVIAPVVEVDAPVVDVAPVVAEANLVVINAPISERKTPKLESSARYVFNYVSRADSCNLIRDQVQAAPAEVAQPTLPVRHISPSNVFAKVSLKSQCNLLNEKAISLTPLDKGISINELFGEEETQEEEGRHWRIIDFMNEILAPTAVVVSPSPSETSAPVADTVAVSPVELTGDATAEASSTPVIPISQPEHSVDASTGFTNTTFLAIDDRTVSVKAEIPSPTAFVEEPKARPQLNNAISAPASLSSQATECSALGVVSSVLMKRCPMHPMHKRANQPVMAASTTDGGSYINQLAASLVSIVQQDSATLPNGSSIDSIAVPDVVSMPVPRPDAEYCSPSSLGMCSARDYFKGQHWMTS